MRGNRDAPLLWHGEVEKNRVKLGCSVSVLRPLLYHNAARKMSVVEHVDDCLSGPGRIHTMVAIRMSASTRTHHDVPQQKNPWTAAGLELEADSKPKLLHEWGMEQCKGSQLLCRSGCPADKGSAQPEGQGRRFRRSAAMMNYVVQGRVDIVYCSKSLAQGMACPCSVDEAHLKQVLRQLRQSPVA